MSTDGKRLAKAWAMTSTASLAVGMTALVVSPIVANILGPERRGRLAAIQLAPQVLADFAALGLGFAIIHFGASSSTSIKTLLAWSRRRILLGAVIMFSIGQLLAGPLTKGAGSDERLFRIYLCIIPIVAMSAVRMESLRAIGDFKTWNLFVLARGLSWPAALIIGIVVPAEPSFTVVVASHLSLLVLMFVVLVAVVNQRIVDSDDEPATTPADFLRYGLVSAVSALPRSANAKLDQVVMAAIVLREDLGLYAAAVGWSGLTIPVMRGLTGISMPRVSGASDEDRPKRVAELLSLGLLSGIAVTAIGLVATLVLWTPLYGEDFARGRSAALVLIPAAVMLEFNAIAGNILRSLERPGLLTIIEASVLGLALVVLIGVVELDAVFGPAALSLASYAVIAGAVLVFVSRSLGVGFMSLFSLPWHLVKRGRS